MKLAQAEAIEFTMLDIEFAAPPRDLEWMEHAGKDALGQPYPFKPKPVQPDGSEESSGSLPIQHPNVAMQKPRKRRSRKTSEASGPMQTIEEETPGVSTQTDAVKKMTPLEWLTPEVAELSIGLDTLLPLGGEQFGEVEEGGLDEFGELRVG